MHLEITVKEPKLTEKYIRENGIEDFEIISRKGEQTLIIATEKSQAEIINFAIELGIKQAK